MGLTVEECSRDYSLYDSIFCYLKGFICADGKYISPIGTQMILLLDTLVAKVREQAVKEFYNKMLSYEKFLEYADKDGNLYFVDFSVWLENTLKEVIGERK